MLLLVAAKDSAGAQLSAHHKDLEVPLALVVLHKVLVELLKDSEEPKALEELQDLVKDWAAKQPKVVSLDHLPLLLVVLEAIKQILSCRISNKHR